MNDIRIVVNEQEGDSIIVLFLHSFSFLKKTINFKKKTYESISVNDDLLRRFEELLNWISRQSKCVFRTIDTLSVNLSQKDYFTEIKDEKAIIIQSNMVSQLINGILRRKRF